MTEIETIRRAAALMRKRVEDGMSGAPVALAVAAWLDTAGADLWAHGPLCCAGGCDECDDFMWQPHVRHALAVAHAYLRP